MTPTPPPSGVPRSPGAQRGGREPGRLLRAWLAIGLIALALLAWLAVRREGVYEATASVQVADADVTRLAAISGGDVRTSAVRELAPAGEPSLSLRSVVMGNRLELIARAPEPQLAADLADTAAGIVTSGLPTGATKLTTSKLPLEPVNRRPLLPVLGAAIPLTVVPGLLPLLSRRRNHARAHPASALDPAKPRRPLRTDIEGMRAIAVVTVVLWHAGVPWLPGGFVGVDIFFVISGFLMSGVLLSQVGADGRVSLRNFYARRARRLLPAALAALVGASVITLLALPHVRWPAVGRDILASALYVVNWRMAAQSVDYLNADVLPSPVQHYWSLSVEEQFYLLWPLLVAGCAWAALRARRSARGLVLTLSLVVFLVSLAVSIRWTATSGVTAYFVTPTRMWELALGSVVACTPTAARRVPGALARHLSWIALGLLAAGVLFIRAADPFPGWRAVVPTVGAALLLWVGPYAGSSRPARFLALAPMQWLGKLSYSIYLWHWPFVVAGMALTGATGHPSLPVGLAAATLSLLPAWLSFRLVEEPVRRHGAALPRGRRDPASLYLGATNSLTAAVTGLVVVAAAWPLSGTPSPYRWSVPAPVYAARGPMGAALLGEDPTTSPEGQVRDSAPTAVPPLDRVADDTGTVDSRDPCTTDLDKTTPVQCPVGDPKGSKLVVVVGDSHAKQWLPALDVIAKERHWRVIGITKSSCPPLSGLNLPRQGQGNGYWQCTDWNTQVATLIGRLKPSVIVTSWARYSVAESSFASAAGRALRTLQAASNATVVVIHDTPRPPQNMAECLLAHAQTQSVCAFARAAATARNGTGQDAVLAASPTFRGIDLTDYICPRATCAPVIGNVVVYRDSNHLTDTYVRSLTDRLRRDLVPLLP